MKEIHRLACWISRNSERFEREVRMKSVTIAIKFLWSNNATKQ